MFQFNVVKSSLFPSKKVVLMLAAIALRTPLFCEFDVPRTPGYSVFLARDEVFIVPTVSLCAENETLSDFESEVCA